MRFRTLLGLSLRGLARNRMRSTLTVLGIAIGIAAVVCVVAIGDAGSEQIENQLTNLGENLVWIAAGSRNMGGVRTGGGQTRTLVLADMVAIQRDVPLIKYCTPQVNARGQVVYANQNWSVSARGVSQEYFTIKRWRVSDGSAFGAEEVDGAENIAVLGETVRQILFPGEDPIGKTIRFNNVPMRVIGVLEVKGMSSFGSDQDDTLLVPYTTVQRKLAGIDWLNDVMCSAQAPEAILDAGDQAAAVLRERHKIRPGQPDDFSIRNPEEQIQMQLDASNTMAVLLISVGAVSLLVGGIGIMNVMLVSVTERTREIGVRMAVGATEDQVLRQFISEAVILCLAGGAFGIVLGIGGTNLIGSTLGWPMRLSVDALMIAMAFSAAIGLLFGFYPARKAAQLDPIEALRFE